VVLDCSAVISRLLVDFLAGGLEGLDASHGRPVSAASALEIVDLDLEVLEGFSI
jgi:hypothetical protein